MFLLSFFLFILISHAWAFKCSLRLIFLIYGSLLFIFFLSYPPKGIQAPQPAVSEPAAAFGHHWVSSYTHIRQTVCWNGLRHLGRRREPSSFMLSQKPYVSAPPTSNHSLAPNTQYFTLDLACLDSLSSMQYYVVLIFSLWLRKQWRNQL